MLFTNPIALNLQAPPDDVFGCVGIEVTADGTVWPLAAVDMAQAMAEMDPFHMVEFQGWIYWQESNGTLSL